MKKHVLLFLLAATSLYATAQEEGKGWQPSVGLSFTTVPTASVTTVSGVSDTSYNPSLSIAPFISLRSKGGFGITYSPKIVTGGDKSGIYMHAVTVGVEQYDQKMVDYAFNYSHYFFTKSTSVPYTPMNNEIYAALTVKQPWLRPTFSAGVGFGKDTLNGQSNSAYDIGVAAGVSHNFTWEGNGTDVSLVPRVMVNAGTNQYFSILNFSRYLGAGKSFTKYVKQGAGSSGRGRRGGSGGSTPAPSTAETFSLSNFELGAEANIEHGNFTVRPSASLYIPSGTAAGTGVFGFWELVLEYRF